MVAALAQRTIITCKRNKNMKSIMSEQNQKSNVPTPVNERRSHQRVQDAIGLRITRLHEMAAAGESDIHRHGVIGARVRRANKYDIEGYAEVKRDFPEVARYVEELEERIRQLQLDGISESEAPTHKVSLSAGGLAFADATLLYPGELIGVTMTLFPSMKRVGCDARVVSAGDAPEIANGEKHTYRITYVRISEADQELIEQHVRGLRQSIPLDNL